VEQARHEGAHKTRRLPENEEVRQGSYGDSFVPTGTPVFGETLGRPTHI
jgi:hypothetical protein